jgi:hypothetical protein
MGPFGDPMRGIDRGAVEGPSQEASKIVARETGWCSGFAEEHAPSFQAFLVPRWTAAALAA